ncbi:glycosyltransferase [Patescibacteria group bacterium]
MKTNSKSKLLFFSGVPIDDAALVYRAGLLAKLINRQGQKVVFTSVSANFQKVKEQEVFGLKVKFIGQAHYQAKINFSNRKSLSLFKVIKETLLTAWRFLKIISSQKPEAVLVFTTMPASLIVGLIAKISRVRVMIDIDDLAVGQMEAMGHPQFLIFLYDRLEKLFVKVFFEKISVCSHFLQARYSGSVLIPNMIDTDWWKTQGSRLTGEKIRQIIFIGHVNAYQGQKEVLGALIPVLRRYPQVKICFVGGGNELEKLKSFARKKKLKSQVVFTGQVAPDQVKKILSQSQIGILPLWDEPVHQARHPLKLLNYLAMGLVVVANEVGEAGKMIKDQKNGLLCPAGDINCLASRVEEVIRQSSLNQKISQQAIKSAQQCSIPKILLKWNDFLRL